MNREEAKAILQKHGISDGKDVRGLSGGRRAQCRVAWNWLEDNPEAAPKRKRKPKTTE